MRRIVVSAFLALIVLVAFSQEKVDKGAVEKIREIGLEESAVMDIAFNLTDASGPRLSGSPGLARASEYAVNQLQEWGMENVGLEAWGEFGKGWEIQKSYIAMTEPYYMPFIAVPKAWTPGTDGLVSGEVTTVTIESEDDFAKYEGQLNGKIVLVVRGSNIDTDFDADAYRFTEEQLDNRKGNLTGPSRAYTPEQIAEWRKRRELRGKISGFLMEQGAAGVVTSSRAGKHGTVFTSNGASYSADAGPVLPEVEMAREHAMLMARLLENGKKVSIEMETKTKFYDDDLNGYNVMAEIPGSGKLKDEVVMLGAHLDSWHGATGATDNAAGSIVMMEAMRILKEAGLKPKRTIRLGLWTSEEQGLYGSRGYVEKHFGDRNTMELKPEHEKLSAYYNIDNGTGRIRGIYLQGNESVRPIFDEWFKPFDDIIDHRTITIRNTGGTDHLAFDAVGLPGFQFIQDPIEYNSRTHHTNMDTYERLVEDDLKQMAVIVASFVYHTAQRDEKLPRKAVETIESR